MNVNWLEQAEADLPVENHWLSASEAVRLASLRFPKRRADWRLGRWTAKRAVAAYLNLPGRSPELDSIEIRPAPSGAPEVFIANQPANLTISLSHRGGVAACAVAQPGAMLGCDLELVEPRCDAFIADYFAPGEQTLIAQAAAADRFRLCALLWSAKESALKALRTGLRDDTRSVIVTLVGRTHWSALDALVPPCEAPVSEPLVWHPLEVRRTNGETFHGWWQLTGDLLRTLAAAPRPAPPVLLRTQSGIDIPSALTTSALPDSRSCSADFV